MLSTVIRLFVIEDHPVVVAGIKNHFRSKRDNIEVTGNSSSVAQAIATADPGVFDLFILDLWLDHEKPEHGLSLLKQAFPGKPVIIYTSETSVSWQQRMMKAGAMAYITKSARRIEIKTAIELVAQGVMVMPKTLTYSSQRKLSLGLTHKRLRLTPNQVNIMKNVAEGLTLSQIAEKNGIAESTVEKTLMQIRGLFNAKNTAELVSILKDENII
jgi:DNA-binding NarL/FixJ family response regulator